MPLKNGCRTLPSADLARYSISASSEGWAKPRSIESPLVRLRVADPRPSGFSAFSKLAAVPKLEPVLAKPFSQIFLSMVTDVLRQLATGAWPHVTFTIQCRIKGLWLRERSAGRPRSN